MPIVVNYTPAGLVGNLASNAGQFATGQATFQNDLESSRLALQQQQADTQRYNELARLEMEGAQIADNQWYKQQQLNSLNQFRQGQVGVRQDANALRGRQIGNQGAYQQGQLAVRGNANDIRQQAVDQQGQNYESQADNRSAVLGLRHDQLQEAVAHHAAMEANAEARQQTLDKQLTWRMSGGNVQLQQQIQSRIAQDTQVRHVRDYMKSLSTQEQHMLTQLQHGGAYGGPLDEQSAVQVNQALAGNRAEQQRTLAQYQAMLATPPQATHQPPSSQPSSPTSMLPVDTDFSGVHPDLVNHIAMRKAQGYSPDEIHNELTGGLLDDNDLSAPQTEAA